MEKVLQEFHCHRCPERGTYILVKLAMDYDRKVVIVCPMCGAKHERDIVQGVIYDKGKNQNFVEEVCPPKSACSQQPITEKMQKETRWRGGNPRDGVVIEKPEEIIRDNFLRELWIERSGNG